MNNTEIKTIEELRAELAEKLESINANIEAWNEAMMNGEISVAVKLDEKLKELEKKYADLSQKITFMSLNGNMLEAIKTHSYPTVKHKDTSEAGSTAKTRERITIDVQFDLYDFDCFNNSHASVNAKWVRLAENFNMLCCIHVANELKIEDLSKISTSYFVSKAAQQVKLADNDADIANPISSTQMLKYLQKVCDSIVYEEKTDKNGKSLGNVYKIKSQDVAWLLFTYGRKDSKNKITLKVANHRNFRKVIADVLYRVVTNGDYKVAYKEMLNK